jgi:transcriptional regulator with XRE-family HTH domain
MNGKNGKEKTLYESLGKVISLRRKRLGMSQEDLAAAANVDRAFISNIERGKRNPSFGSIARIASGLRMRYARLVHNIEQHMSA